MIQEYRLYIAVAAFATVSAVSHAQVCTTAVDIAVERSTGAPIAGAVVSLHGASESQRTTAANGRADFHNVTCGVYSLEVAAEGFQPAARQNIELTELSGSEVRVTLEDIRRESVDVHATAESVHQSDSDQLHGSDAKDLPGKPATVTDALPMIPGIVRSPEGGLVLQGVGEHRSAFMINQADVTDPATGGFGKSIPVDSVESVDVLKTPFIAEYGRFSADVVAVQTRRGGDKWRYEVNDLFPDFRFRSWHINGVRDVAPRGVLNGPLITDRLFFASTVEYDLNKLPNRTLPYPFNESKQETTNSFVQMDAIVSPRQIITSTFHMPLQHISFVNPDYFNPQPVTPNYRQHNYEGTILDTLQMGGGVLASAVSIQRFDAGVWGQGTTDMVLTPEGNFGNYFARQDREAGRYEWTEAWSLPQKNWLGSHAVKVGTSAARMSNTGEFFAHPVEIRDSGGALLEQISFTGGNPFQRNDLEIAEYAQDHWNLGSRLAVDLGSRFERQQIADSFRIAPRAGIAWMPFPEKNTVLSAGYGLFYDNVPLNVYAFNSWPQQVITMYAPNGAIVSGPTAWMNIIGTGLYPGGWLTHTSDESGSFTPTTATWRVQGEHTFSPFLKLRVNYSDSHSDGLVIIQPQTVGDANALLMSGAGRSRYRQLEITNRVAWGEGRQLFLAYTRSRAQGDLNEFSNFLGNFPSPLVRPNVFTNLPGDLPNRFLAWGRIRLPMQFQIMPLVEYRNGIPYARVDALGNYVGTPNSDQTRYPRFFSADARVMKDIRVNTKYTVRFSVSGMNLTNHFNPLDVHANIADPAAGVFFGNYKRRFLADFDVIF